MKFRNYHGNCCVTPDEPEETHTWVLRLVDWLAEHSPAVHLPDTEELCTTGSTDACREFVQSLKQDCEYLLIKVTDTSDRSIFSVVHHAY